MVVVAICPVLLVAIPAMVDYPNHVARMYVLAVAGTPDANPFYEVSKTLYSNLAMEFFVPPLARILGVEAASKVFLIACQLLIVSGAIALELAVKRRHEISGLAAVMLLYSFPFAWGFLNFQFGLGVALWGLAVWEFMRGRGVVLQLVAHSLFVVGLYFAHLFGLGVYAATLGLLELSRFNRLRNGIIQLAILSAPILGVFAVLLASPGQVGNGPTEWEIAWKFMTIFGKSLNGYSTKLAVVEAAALTALCYVLFRTGRLSLGRSGLWLAGGFVLLFLAMPYRLLGIAYIDARMPIVALLILPAYTKISMTRRAAALATAVPIGIALVNVAVTSAVWLSHQDDYAKLKASFTLLDRPSRVLVGSTDGPVGLVELAMYHAPTLAVSAKAMVTTLFALPGMQPINVVKEYRNQAITDVIYFEPMPFPILVSLATGTDDPRVPRFLHHWTSEFDYLYLVGPRIANPLPGRIEELSGGKLFTMYRISPIQKP